MSIDQAPFAGLTPDVVLESVESIGLRTDGRQLALNSYENRVYQIGIEDNTLLIAKFYRPSRWSDVAIGEEHAFTTELATSEIPVIAPLAFGDKTLHRHQDFRFALYPRRGGRAPELGDEHILAWMGRIIGRIHQIGARKAFVERPSLNIESFGIEPRDWLLSHNFLPSDLVEAWRTTVDMALEGTRHCFARAGDIRVLRLHGDCHGGNVLWTDAGPHFVDFDDARMGPAVQDLWLLLSGERNAMEQQLAVVLRGYEQFREFDRRELYLIEALRTLRLIHYAAWIARRWNDPAFPAAFTWFNTSRYWQERILELKEQIALMEEPPLAPDACY
ncbi:MAG TPA: serine/threonine protein kinase [Rhodocyclaceae bacterium]|nr:serine/threonine protein kinase [Rhodocyclaceae bacterium]